MNYSEEIKDKIKNLYYSSIKIGIIKDSKNLFEFLNKYEFKENIKEGIGKTVSDISSENLEGIYKEIVNTPYLFNNIGTNFLQQLKLIKENRGGLNFLENDKPIKIIEIKNEEYLIKIKNKAESISNKYGLKECFYVFNNALSEKRNFIDAMLGFNEVDKELEKIQKLFNIKDSYLVGNKILGIELFFNKKEEKGEYNSCNNRIVLNDKENIPLVHEYVHFIDKTSTSLLLTGKTTKELFEEGKYNVQEIINIFNMNNINKMKSSGILDYFNTKSFNKIFNQEIMQNEFLYEKFNNWSENESKQYIDNFKKSMFKWINKQNVNNKTILIKEVNKIINSENYNNDLFENKDILYKNIENSSLLYMKYNKNKEIKENNFMLFSKILDSQIWNRKNTNTLFEIKKETYYESQKEMLARTIESYSGKTLKELSNVLSTPTFNKKENEEVLNIVKSWKNNIDEILSLRKKNEVTNRIKDISKKFNKNDEQIKKIVKSY